MSIPVLVSIQLPNPWISEFVAGVKLPERDVYWPPYGAEAENEQDFISTFSIPFMARTAQTTFLPLCLLSYKPLCLDTHKSNSILQS